VTEVKHRVHVVPWLRRPGSVLLKEWLAITIGRDIFSWRELNPTELRHELAHVRQWKAHGAAFPLVYLGASLRAAARREGWYRGNRFEVEARRVAGQG
jgi:hypothetical protein